MNTPKIRDLKVFVPCGAKGQAESISFYQDLGFKLLWGGDGNAVCEIDTGHGQRFLLLEKCNQQLATNLMLQFWVEDVDAWAAHLATIGLEGKYAGVKVAVPEVMPWGWKVLHVWDPAGVLLHFAEPHAEENKHFFLGENGGYDAS